MTWLWLYLGATVAVLVFWLLRVRLRDPKRYKLRATARDMIVVAAAWPLVLLAGLACLILSRLNRGSS